MDQIRALGNNLVETIVPTYTLLGNILNEPENASRIRATKRETFSYGPHERHALDLFTPSSSTGQHTKTGEHPVMLFVYGGGFMTGSKNLEAVAGELVYANLGSFFAESLSFEIIIMDYTLVQHGARYPSGGNEIDLVTKWLEKRYEGKPKRDFYIMGNSAGGVHVFTWLLEQRFQQTVQRLSKGEGALKLKALVPLGSPFRWPPENEQYQLREALEQYYGDSTKVKTKSPTSVLEREVSDQDGQILWPPVLLIVSELDPDYIRESGQEFLQLWKKAGGKGSHWVLDGHNHLSPVLVLSTHRNDLEKWGYDLIDRIHELEKS